MKFLKTFTIFSLIWFFVVSGGFAPPIPLDSTCVAVSMGMINKPSIGTAFAFHSDGENTYLLTAGHVVENSTEIILSNGSPETFRGDVLRVDKKRDLALLSTHRYLPTIPLLPLGLAAEIQPGKQIFVLGSVAGYKPFPGMGTVIDIADRVILVSARVTKGCSGAPCIMEVDGTFYCIGIVQGYTVLTDYRLTILISLQEIYSFLEEGKR